MNILDIYKKYQIMPQLQEHQLRVAAVGGVICEHFAPLPNPPRKGEGIRQVDRENIVAACLLHDMGNIIKFNLKVTQNLLNRDIDIEYWQTIKDAYVKKYGNDEHEASMEIAKELDVSRRILDLIDAVGFLTAVPNAEGADFGKKICQYADDRVGPLGVISLEQRFADLRKRYQNHKYDTQDRDNFENSLRKIEKQIFAHCSIRPDEITEEAIADGKERLKSFEI
jgi:5'-deoxynucleotidase YfbR-like HD superfamily hydrolase